MTLGELKADLRSHGISVVGSLRSSNENGQKHIVVFFSSDKNVVFPSRLKNIFPLPMKSGADDENVNIEKVKALKRSLIPGWQHD
jgi:hypothetical protein